MKFKLLVSALVALMICTTKAGAQITLDNTYPTPSSDLYMVNLERSGPKYVIKTMDSGNRYLKFYNLNHSLWKTIDCNPFRKVKRANNATIFPFGCFYISESLFDCDTNIELIYTSFDGGWPDRTLVDI